MEGRIARTTVMRHARGRVPDTKMIVVSSLYRAMTRYIGVALSGPKCDDRLDSPSVGLSVTVTILRAYLFQDY